MMKNIGEELTRNVPIKKDKEVILYRIDEKKMEDIAKLSNDLDLWIKVVDQGFMANDKVISKIEGQIIDVNPYYIRWEERRPEKKPFEPGKDGPEGYDLRVDLKVLIIGQVVGLSLSQSSVKYHLAPYLKYLINKGYRLEDVITRMRVKSVANKFGTFNVVFFEFVGLAEAPPLKDSSPSQLQPTVEAEMISKATLQGSVRDNPWD